MMSTTDDSNSAPTNETFDPSAQRGKMFGSLGLEAPAAKGPEIVTEPPSDANQPVVLPADDKDKKPVPNPEKAGEKVQPSEKPDTLDEADADDLDPIDEETGESDEGDETPTGETDEPFTEQELEAMRRDDSHAIKTAKEEGKKRKFLEREKQSLEETNVKLTQELEEARADLEKYTVVRIDPTTHPDFIAAKKKTHGSIIAAIDNEVGSDAAEIFEKQGWGDELTAASRMIDATVAERRKIKEPLKLAIAKKLGLVPRETQEFDAVVDGEAIKAVDQVIAIMSRHTGDYDKLADIYGTIQSKAESKGLEAGHKEYVALTQPVRESILSLSTMTEKDIQEDPDSLQSLAALKIQSSKEEKARFDKISKSVIEMAFGPETLNQEELDRHAQAGKDMTEFQKNRERRVKDFRQKRLPEIAAAWVLWPEIKKALPGFIRKSREEAAQKGKKDVVRKTTTKQPSVQEEKPVAQSRDELREKVRKSLKIH